MDVALLFFLPLIGGFLFVERFYGTRFRAAREETQRLYYKAAFWGVALSIVGLVLHHALRHVAAYRDLADQLGRAVLGPLLERPPGLSGAPDPVVANQGLAVRIDVAFACAWALALGVATPALNGLVALVDRVAYRPRGRSLISAINDASITDQFERLLAEALRASRQIQVTLSNQKVYIGWVTRSPNPHGQEKYFRIQPSMSGYRSKDDGEVQLTTFYDDILERFRDDRARLRSYEIVIPIDKIVSASGFDLAAYVEFQAHGRARARREAPVQETRVSGDVTVYLGRPLRRS